MPEVAKIHNFGGLVTSIGNPQFASAESISNCVRYRTRGWLEQPDPYGVKFANGLPTDTTAQNGTGTSKLTNIAWKDIINFSVTEHGGADITVAVGTYRKTSRYDNAVYIDRCGIWMRPYWSGAAWIDAWMELTECEILKVIGFSGTDQIDFAANGYTTDYFKNWIAVFENFTPAQDIYNYLLITSSGPDHVHFFGDITNLQVGRAVDAKMILVRSFLNKELPATVISQLFRLLHEIRFTSGVSALDVSLMGGLRTKTWGWATSDKNMDRLIVDVSALDIWRYVAQLDLPVTVVDADPLPAGAHYLKIAIVTDDNQISDLRLPFVSDGNITLNSQKNQGFLSNIVSDGTYLYGVTAAGVLIKYRQSDLGVVTSLTITSPGGTPGDQYGSYNNKIVRIGTTIFIQGMSDKIGLTMVDSVSMAILHQSYSTANPLLSCAAMCTDGTNIFFGASNGAAVAYLAKYEPASYTFTTWLALAAGECNVVDIVSDGTYVYCVLDNSPAKYLKIRCSDLTKIGITRDCNAGQNNAKCIYVFGAYVLIGCGTTPGILVQIIATTQDILTALALPTGYSGPYALTDDGIFVHGIVSSATMDGLLYKAVISNSVITYDSIVPIVYPMSHKNLITTTDYFYTPIETINKNSKTKIICDGTTRIDIKALISAGALPQRARYIRIYHSTDGTLYYRCKDIDLYDTTIVWDAAAFYDSIAKHFYHRSAAISIKGADMLVSGADAVVDLGRTVTEKGIVRYKVGTLVGYKTYVGNVLVSDLYRYANKILHNIESGDAVQQIDVFTFDASHSIDIEYSDGDEIVGLAPFTECLLALKKRSIVLVSPDGRGGYTRNIVTQAVGCCSAQGIAVFDDVAYWPDYHGLHSLSVRDGLKLLNPDWIEDWKLLTDAQKEATVSVIDRVNKLWIVSAAGYQWTYDLKDGQWMRNTFTDVPTRMVQDITGTIDFLTATKLETINKVGADRFDGQNYSFHWESNEIAILAEGKGFAYDILTAGFVIEYESDIPITFEVFLDEDATAIMTEVLDEDNTRMLFQAPFGARCKTFRIKFSGTTTAANQEWTIKKCDMYYDLISVGGDMVNK